MYLTELEIKREQWGADKGKFSGRARFENELGNITLRLSPEHIEQIFKVCADSIISVSKQAAAEFTAKTIEHREQIEQ